MKICPRCGTSCNDEMRFCMNCGSQLGAASAAADDSQEGSYRNYDQSDYERDKRESRSASASSAPAGGRSIPLCVILTLITCGLYGLYWMAVINDDVNAISGDVNAPSGGMVVLFNILTCGLYGIYWQYKIGDRIDEISGAQKNTGLIYLILSLLQLDIVAFCLSQDFLNRQAG